MNDYSLRIKDWPEHERPRERLLKWGADKLTDAELLAILLRVGGVEDSAMDLARRLLQRFGGFRGIDSRSVAELCQINGIGPAKTAQIKAALEIGRRASNAVSTERPKIDSSRDAYIMLRPYLRDLSREVFKVLFLTARNNLIVEKTLFEGSLTESLVNAREVVKESLNQSAASVIFAHNHPSGNPSPSAEDKRITTHLIDACKLVGISVLDHIIIGKETYFSFADEGLV